MKKTSGAFFAVVSIAFVGASEVRAGDLFGPTGYHNWSGIYLGGQIGGFWSDINGGFVSAPLATWNSGPSGGIGGGFVGIQHEFGSIVLGVEGGYLDTFEDGGSDICHPALSCVAGATQQGRIGSIWTVGPRLGWDAGQFMPYITGGYANAVVENDFVDISGSTLDLSRNRLDGWYFGGGVDMALNGDWKLGVEYRHYDFDDETITPHDTSGTPVLADRWSLDTSADTVTARLSYVFGRNRYEPEPLK
jgi:outer membrane immunogenic protein